MECIFLKAPPVDKLTPSEKVQMITTGGPLYKCNILESNIYMPTPVDIKNYCKSNNCVECPRLRVYAIVKKIEETGAKRH